MPFQIVRDDITRVSADVIVNTANPYPAVGGGTDSAVYRAAGERQLLAERKRIGNIAPGQAAVTPAFNLSAKYIIHTVGPVWEDGFHGERDILRSCYGNSLAKAADLKAESVAFPLIATGVYGFPKDEALSIALDEIGRFLLTHDMTVILVVFDRASFELSGQLVSDIDEFIDDHGVMMAREAEYGSGAGRSDRRMNSPGRPAERRVRPFRAEPAAPEKEERFPESAPSPGKHIPKSASAPGEPFPESAPAPDEWFPISAPAPITPFTESTPVPEDRFFDAAPAPKASGASFMALDDESLDDMLRKPGDTFQQKLFQLIDESGMDDVTVYKKANIDRKVFSRIRCREDYRPTKKTAVAFAIALRLDMSAMLDLLSRAEIAFSPSSKFDLIITYFVTHGIYDIFEINAALFRYGQPILGE